MTQEEKAKAYDEAIKVAADIKAGTATYITDGTPVIDAIFPELKESKDEKIRKVIYGWIYTQPSSFFDDGFSKEEMLAWLEKQGEQKSTDNIESKFKVGDWVVYKENIYQIHNISLKKYYECLRTDGTVHTFDFNYVDLKSHLWTIQDAKKGDVLVCKGNIKNSNGIKYERICLFNNLDNAFFTLVKTSNNVETYDIDVNIDYPDNTVPATKEQKEILFMTMKKAGYEWDDEKKELKKKSYGQRQECVDCQFNYAGECKGSCAMKRDKQKHADKIEPKFKTGDWTVSKFDGKTRQISEVHYDEYNNYYVVGSHEYDVEDYDRLHHLWTIQDAKDGDVLATNRSIFIFSQKYITGKPEAHCGIINSLLLIKPEGCWTNEKYYPATKEQRDTLMKAMDNAGYTFDFEKKELRKIEQKPDSGGFWEGYNTAKEKFEQNHAWSKEDEKIYQSIMDDTVQENQLNDKQTDWLKSLKERYTWKPSDEQITWLYRAADVSDKNSRMKQVLNELLSDLKKLK